MNLRTASEEATPFGHHQVSDQESSLGNPLRIGRQVSHLAVHLFENPFDYLRIVRGIRELF